MSIRDAVAFACANLIKSPMKTILTVLGLGVGIGAIITVLTLGDAGQHQVEHEIARLGVSKVWITPETGGALPADGARTVAAATGAPACAGAATMSVIRMGDVTGLAQISGYDGGYAEVHAPVVVEGRLPTAGEFASGAAVATADEGLAGFLGDPMGRLVDVGGRRVRIIGITAGRQVQAAAVSNGSIMIPLRTFLDTFADASVSEITVDLPKGLKADEVAASARLHLGGDGVRVTSLQNEIDAARSIIRVFVMVLASVAAVCMLTGGIGVMNVLLMSVRERRREIGLIKAIGGTSGQIALLFLLEAAVYALLGGVVGVGLGGGMIALFGRMIGLQAGLHAGVTLPTLLCAALLGLLFGVAPALRAAGLLPVAALRQEE